MTEYTLENITTNKVIMISFNYDKVCRELWRLVDLPDNNDSYKIGDLTITQGDK